MEYGFNTPTFKTTSADGQNFVLTEAVIFHRPDGSCLTMPIGCTSDGASTPHPVWNILPPFGKYWRAAFLHDFLYRSTQYPKSFCDTVLLEAMESIGVDSLERDSIYYAVKYFGEDSFNADRQALQKTPISIL